MVSSDSILVYSVPWDVTVTYRSGSFKSPGFIQSAMTQLDEVHPFSTKRFDLSFLPVNSQILDLQDQYKPSSSSIISTLNHGTPLNPRQLSALKDINIASNQLNDIVFSDVQKYASNPLVLLGGEHGVGVGYLRSLSSQYDHFSVLQIDAHMDCRVKYFGYEFSHASVMTHYASHAAVTGITQVGIRDYAIEETQFQTDSDTSFYVFDDYKMHKELFQGRAWHAICSDILATLSDRVFISLDVDGLMTYLCQSTGTPVPGGLSYNQLVYLLELVSTNKTIIGSELVEVHASSSEDWNAAVGARLLYLLAGGV